MSLGNAIVSRNVDLKSDQPQDPLPEAPALYMEIHISGTTDTGQTLTLDDIASSLQIMRGGTPVINIDANWANNFAKEILGDVDTVSGSAATAETVTLIIPFFHPDFVQIVDMAAEEYSMNLQFDNTTLSTRFGSNAVTADIDIITADGLDEAYTPKIFKDSISVGATNGQNKAYAEPNIVSMYFRERNSANITQLAVEQTRPGRGVKQHFSNRDLDGLRRTQRVLRAFSQDDSSPVWAEWNGLDAQREISVKSSRTAITFDADASGDLDIVRFRLDAPKGDVLSRARLQEI